jgi:hypothetical protein
MFNLVLEQLRIAVWADSHQRGTQQQSNAVVVSLWRRKTLGFHKDVVVGVV